MAADKCCKCGFDLGAKKTIFAAQGQLFCEEQCGRETYDNWDDVKEEVIPEDIGIPPVCAWCGEEEEERVETDFGLLCRQCIQAIRSRGIQVCEKS
jgi:hypothetical protein